MADIEKFLDRNFREIRSGLVALSDFQEYLQGLGTPPDVREQCKSELSAVDADGSGEIQFEAFQEWFDQISDPTLAKLLRRMAWEEHQQIKRESVQKADSEGDQALKPVIRAMFRISDRNNNGHVTKNELVELMSNFGFASLEDGDEDWIELEEDEDVSFDEFYEWWTIDGSYKYTGGGIYGVVAAAHAHFSDGGDTTGSVLVEKDALLEYLHAVGCNDGQIGDALVMFDKALAFDNETNDGISFEATAALLQDMSEDAHVLLRDHARKQEYKDYKVAEKVTAQAMFRKFDKNDVGSVPASVLDTLLTEFGIGKVDMSDEDISGDVEFDGIFEWWYQEGRYKDEEPTPGVVGLRGLLYVNKHFVPSTEASDASSVDLKTFYQYLLHASISEYDLQKTITGLETGSESDEAAAMKVSFREFVSNIDNVPDTVHELLRHSAKQTLAVPVPDAEEEDADEEEKEEEDQETAPQEEEGVVEEEAKEEEPEPEPVPVARAAPVAVKKEEPKRASLDTSSYANDLNYDEGEGEEMTFKESLAHFCKHEENNGETVYCNNTCGNWAKIWACLLSIWFLLGVVMMGLLDAHSVYGVSVYYTFLTGFTVVLIVIILSVIVGTFEQQKADRAGRAIELS